MNALWRRVEVRRGQPVFATTGEPIAASLDRLEQGENPGTLVKSLGLTAADVVSAIAHAALGEDDQGGPPLVQGKPVRPKLARATSEASLSELFPRASRPARLALSAGLLQILDFWDESHEAAQRAEDLGERAVSAYWHGIAHRREPDAGNAAYWFRKIGRHPVFPALASAAREVLSGNPTLADRLTPRGDWDPFAFVQWCGSTAEDEPSARALQRAEMILLLEASLPS